MQASKKEVIDSKAQKHSERYQGSCEILCVTGCPLNLLRTEYTISSSQLILCQYSGWLHLHVWPTPRDIPSIFRGFDIDERGCRLFIGPTGTLPFFASHRRKAHSLTEHQGWELLYYSAKPEIHTRCRVHLGVVAFIDLVEWQLDY